MPIPLTEEQRAARRAQATCGDSNPEGSERCGRQPGHLGFHRHVMPGGVSWVGNVPGIDDQARRGAWKEMT